MCACIWWFTSRVRLPYETVMSQIRRRQTLRETSMSHIEQGADSSAAVEVHALERRRRHLRELHENGLVDGRERPVAAEREELEQPDHPPVERRERRRQPRGLRVGHPLGDSGRV